MSQVSDMALIESATDEWLSVPGPDKYRATLKSTKESGSSQLIHQQSHFDKQGTPLGEVIESIAWVMGSGRKGRAYFIVKDHMLFQSPIGWYTAKNCWDLSPGYNPENHPGFQRRIDNSCLYCHAGRVDSKNDSQYSPRVFHEAKIGCERCHGPGETHVQFHRNNKDNDIAGKNDIARNGSPTQRDPICNPANLPANAREDVCNQCHLQAENVIPRFGRNFFDFRPGDRLEDVFVVFAGNSRPDSRDQDSRNAVQAVSHVEQMRQSGCYQASLQKMGCISCHDPHGVPNDTEKVQHYRMSCLKCHNDQSCAITVADRRQKSQDDSCIDCHMPRADLSNVPHTVQTDHRILRDPKKGTKNSRSNKAWTLFDGAQERLPAWEISRARGLTMITNALKRRDPAMANKAREYLMPKDPNLPQDANALEPDQALEALANDPDSLSAIASSYWLEGLNAVARPFWEKTLQIDPRHETALSGLIQIDLSSKDFLSAERFARQLTEAAPAEATHWVQLSTIYWEMKRYEDAIKAAENAVRLAPNLDETQAWLKQAKQKLSEDPVAPTN